ncbi:MAG: hypothetical protein WC044_04935 [Crocinitomicaceae bacterium]
MKNKKYLEEYITVLLISFLGVLFSVFLAKPKIPEIMHMLEAKNNLWEAIEFKKNHIFSNLSQYDPNSGEAKYVFRLTVPLIMKFFQLNVFQMYWVQITLGFSIFVLWVSIFKEFIHDKKGLILITLCLASSYYGKAFIIDSGTAVNVLSYFLILFSIKFRNVPVLFCPSLFMLFFNDERGILAFSIIALFILFFKKDIEHKLLTKSFYLLIGSFTICVFIRLLLMLSYGMHLPLGEIGFGIFTNQWKYVHLGLFSGLVGLSIPFVIQLINELSQKKYFFFFSTSFVLIIFIIGTSIVSDMTKSIAYLTPLFILFMWRMLNSNKDYQLLIYAVLITNILFPTIVVVGDKQFEFYSFTFDIIFKVHSLFV